MTDRGATVRVPGPESDLTRSAGERRSALGTPRRAAVTARDRPYSPGTRFAPVLAPRVPALVPCWSRTAPVLVPRCARAGPAPRPTRDSQ